MMQLMPAWGAAAIGVLLVAAGGAVVHADFAVPAPGLACSTSGAMTVLPDGTEFLICKEQTGVLAWAPVRAPVTPNDSWVSYGPEITLHGEGAGNPSLESGQWSAIPRDPATQCGASQVTDAGHGASTPPQTVQGKPGQALMLTVLPKLFTISLTGDCSWTKQPN